MSSTISAGKLRDDKELFSQKVLTKTHCAVVRRMYIALVNYLTKQEQFVLCLVMTLLLTGWAVKTYRTAHPPFSQQQQAKP